jgi:hypothetical protein
MKHGKMLNSAMLKLDAINPREIGLQAKYSEHGQGKISPSAGLGVTPDP